MKSFHTILFQGLACLHQRPRGFAGLDDDGCLRSLACTDFERGIDRTVVFGGSQEPLHVLSGIPRGSTATGPSDSRGQRPKTG